MELAQAKIPYLPPDWTLARAAKYAAKLGVFILVPGLHQIACKRRILGGLLLVLYFAAEFTLSNRPSNDSDLIFPTYALATNLSEISQYISWFMLAVDFKKIEFTKLKLNPFLVLSCAAGIYFIPYHDPGVLNVHIENNNFACPAFCRYDIVEYERYYEQHARHLQRISVGDHVIVGIDEGRRYTSKILAGPPEEACTGDGRTSLRLPVGNYFCKKDFLGNYLFKYLILGGPNPKFTNPEGKKISMIPDFQIHGVYPNKIGNTHKYFILTDAVTDMVGNTLLTVYGWTGLNLMGLSKLHTPLSHKHM